MAKARANCFLENLIPALVGHLLGSIGGGVPAELPPLAAELTDLAARVAANDAVIEHVNQKRPDGAAWLASAELVARQLKSFFDGPSNIPRITQHMRLPAFRYAGLDPYTWPRPHGS